MKKIKIGIEVDEILRAKWLQFDRYYVTEFGEEGVPEQPYSFDFFNDYKFEDKIEERIELKEPEDMPENINPIDYQVNEDGEANADIFINKPKEKVEVTAKELYNRFMYEDYCFEIHGSAPQMYKELDLHLGKFFKKYSDHVDFVIVSKENWFTTPPTLFFLSKVLSRFKRYVFVEEDSELWDDVDVLITTNPKAITNKPEGKKLIKLDRPYNMDLTTESDLPGKYLQVNDLYENEEFEKLIEYKKQEENE